MSRPLAPTRRPRSLAGALALALPATLLVAAPGTASAETTDETFTWKVSQQFVDHFAKASYNQNTFVASDGASLTDERATVFTDGTGWVNPTTGDASVQYDGTITGSFVVGAPQYSIALSDPAITIKDGIGQVTADVAWTVPSDTANPSGGDDDVVVTTFAAEADDWNAGSLTATPDWSTQSFAPEFMEALNPGLRAHFRTTGSASDAKKAPAPFTATAAAPSATATVTSATRAGLHVRVAGSGYQPGGVGVYVGITEAGPVNSTDATAYLATVWVPGSQIAADGSFERTLELDPEDLAKLDPAKTYEVHTQKAHGQSAGDPSQNVRLPLALDIPSLQLVRTTTSVTSVETRYSAKGAEVTVSVPGATGPVRLTLGGSTRTRWLSDGTATFSVPTLLSGAYTARADYQGSASHAASSGSGKVTVRTTPTRTTTTVTRTPTSTSGGRVDIKVTNTATGTSPAPKGTATITLTRDGRTVKRTTTLTYGKASPALPRVSKGWWKMKVSYSGEHRRFQASSRTTTVKVTR